MSLASIASVLTVAAVLLGGAGPATAEPARPAFHDEAARLVDELTDQIRRFGAQIERHLSPRVGGGGAPGHHGPGHHGPGHHGPGHHGMMGPGGPGAGAAERPLITIMLHHRTEIGLSDEQVQRLETLRSDFAREAIRREAEVRIAELDLAALLEREPVDMAKVEAKVREIGQLRAEMRIARLRTLEQGKAVLTADQRARLQGILGGGMHRPMAGVPRAADAGRRF